ncbi:N-acetylglucosamine-6-phosphate deacetylase [Roseibium limicola]|uniref:N-acetylglucosamine-6-phosphate deacetylase n=1 Tax=Roseibium limicola TaxID=2816037 RepID=UPI001AD8FBF7|nr:N-acetylglucosamine-6-phosphate deacetylase [Roseibium limicola]
MPTAQTEISPVLVTGARIFDGHAWHEDRALAVSGSVVAGIGDEAAFQRASQRHDCEGCLIVPGFVDLQVNGGGGVLLNNDPSLAGIQKICSAHRAFGTTALLPTLITDTAEITERAIAAGVAATQAKVSGFAGLHLEGPHLSVARKGTHSPDLIRPMTEDDVQRLVEAALLLPKLLVTLAPESTTPDQVRALVEAEVVVSLGHSNAGLDDIRKFVAAGATMVTHLFNAMSPLHHRDPGLVGAAIGLGELSCGLIADGHHVDPLAIQIALDAKRGPGHVFLVTDAMSSIGSTEQSFQLNGREVFRRGGRLTLADGTLAGADIDMLSCVRFMIKTIGMGLDEAVRMATRYPAEACGLDGFGLLASGNRADFLVLNKDMDIQASVIGGEWLDHRELVA